MVSEGILKVCGQACETLTEEFCKTYGVEDYQGEDVKMRYLKAYLHQVKYSLRKAKAGKDEKSS